MSNLHKYMVLLTMQTIFYFDSANGIKVLRSLLKLEDDGKGMSGAKLVHDSPTLDKPMRDISLCLRFNYKILGRWEQRSQLIHIEEWRNEPGDSEFQMLNLGALFPYSFFAFGYPRQEGSYKSFVIRDPETGGFEVWATNRWSHFCLTYQQRSGHVRLIKDGKATNVNHQGVRGIANITFPRDFLHKVYIARCSFNYSNKCSTPEGQVTDFNIWDRALSERESKDWTSCQSFMKGNVVNWDTAKFDILNMTEYETTMDSVCIPPRPGHVMMPMRRNFTSHQEICKKFKGRASVISDKPTQDFMNEEIKKYPACGNPSDSTQGRYWAGWHDEDEEGTYVNANNGERLDHRVRYNPWYLGEPNGDKLENCAMVWVGRNAWNDVQCKHFYCSFCELESAPDLQIRGLCDSSKFDTKYSWTRSMIDGRHSFRGYTGTMLHYNDTYKQWVLQPHHGSEDVFAVTDGPEYPFGNHKWIINGDPCYSQSSSEVTLNINACDNTEFNCNDGYCVNINMRCDGRSDCPDKSDEVGCKILTTDISYLKDVPPPPPILGSLTNVNLSVDVLQILEIQEVDNIITLQSEVKLTWMDKRLTFNNLKKEINLNTLIPVYRDSIWIPEIVFYNTQDKAESLNDEKAFATIERVGDFEQSPRRHLQSSYIFRGSENPITISRVYDSEFLCKFDMATYPFDTQVCSIIITMKGNTDNFINIVGSYVDYSGPVDLTQYFIKKFGMEEHVVRNGKKALKVDIIFGRRVLATILTTYLPTVLLCIVCFSTNYFKPFFFEAIVTVNLTSLLVLTTLFISVFNSLPTTAYVKMIDVWLIFNLLVPFSEVLLHTWIDSLREEDYREVNHHGKTIRVNTKNPENKVDVSLIDRDEKVEVMARKKYYEQMKAKNVKLLGMVINVARFGLPAVFGTFTVIYFIVGFSQYYSDS